MPLIEILRAKPAFAELSEGLLDLLDTSFGVEAVEPGTTLIQEGTAADAIYVLLAGEVAVIRDRGGELRELARLGAGDFFGLITLVDNRKRSASCRAVTRCKVARLEIGAANLLLNQHAPIAAAFQLALASQLARDFRALDRRIRDRLLSRDR